MFTERVLWTRHRARGRAGSDSDGKPVPSRSPGVAGQVDA